MKRILLTVLIIGSALFSASYGSPQSEPHLPKIIEHYKALPSLPLGKKYQFVEKAGSWNVPAGDNPSTKIKTLVDQHAGYVEISETDSEGEMYKTELLLLSGRSGAQYIVLSEVKGTSVCLKVSIAIYRWDGQDYSDVTRALMPALTVGSFFGPGSFATIPKAESCGYRIRYSLIPKEGIVTAYLDRDPEPEDDLLNRKFEFHWDPLSETFRMVRFLY